MQHEEWLQGRRTCFENTLDACSLWSLIRCLAFLDAGREISADLKIDVRFSGEVARTADGDRGGVEREDFMYVFWVDAASNGV
jgi:hypothetical protein